MYHNYTYHLVRRTRDLYDVTNKQQHQVPFIDSIDDEKSLSSRGSQKHSSSDKTDDGDLSSGVDDVTKSNDVTNDSVDLCLSDVLTHSSEFY